MSKTVLITGGAGFIASHIVDRCVEAGYRTVVIDKLSTGSIANLNPAAIFHQLDIRSEEAFSVVEKERPEAMIHHAAQIDVRRSLVRPDVDADINITGTIAMLRAAQAFGVKQFIFASSAAVYGHPQALPIDEQHPCNPLSFYGASKLAAEQYIRLFAELYGLSYTIFRYANAYGIRQDPKGEGGVVSIFTSKLIAREPFILYGDGEQTRDFIYVDDIVSANMLALQQPGKRTLNISTNTPATIVQLAQLFRELTGHPQQELIHRPERPGEIRHSALDNRRALEELGWEPQYSLREGLDKTIHYYY